MDKTFSEITAQIILGWKVIKLGFEASRRWAFGFLFFELLSSLTPTASLYISKLSIDAIIAAIKNPVTPNIHQVLIFAALALTLRIIATTMGSLSNHCLSVLRDIFVKFIEFQIINKAASLDLDKFYDPIFYDKLENINRHASPRAKDSLQLAVEIGTSIIGSVSLFVLLWRLSFWVPIILIIFYIPRLVYRLHYSYMTHDIFHHRSPYSRKVGQIGYLMTHKDAAAEIRIFNLKDYFLKLFSDLHDKFIAENQTLSAKQTIFTFFLDLLSGFVYYGLALFAAFQAIYSKITIGDLTMFTGTIDRFQSNLMGLFAQMARFYEHNLFLADYFDLMSQKSHIESSPGLKSLPNKNFVTVEFKNVSFGYEQDKLILKDINFKISDARNFALVGENGAGKTTLVKLMLHLYEPTSGKILINGVDIRDIPIKELRQNLGVIFQDYMHYEMTAQENIAFGDLRHFNNLTRIRRAAQLSGAAEFIEKWPEKYKTMLGKYFEKGEELSGGQWQKIALARAFFSDAKVLIMDEPTASLDPKSEYEVFKNLVSATKEKSLVLISHRFSTVRLADEILVLRDGEIAEQGSHDQLMKKNGRYAKLYNLQAKWYK